MTIDAQTLTSYLVDAEKAHAAYVLTLPVDQRPAENARWPEWYGRFIAARIDADTRAETWTPTPEPFYPGYSDDVDTTGHYVHPNASVFLTPTGDVNAGSVTANDDAGYVRDARIGLSSDWMLTNGSSRDVG